ncbi:MAG: Ldh family oxidoreductase [Isosphaeraceae bacterium]
MARRSKSPSKSASTTKQGPTRLRLDDLRRLGTALGSAVGLSPSRAAALTTQLVWFDMISAERFGIATLMEILEQIERGEIDPKADGVIGAEHAATANLDGQRGVPILILARAASLASEKARDVGVGLVRVTGLGPLGSAAPLAAEMAIGPEAGLVLGPQGAWSLALPTSEGLPAVFDSALAGPNPPGPPTAVQPWGLLVPDGGWLVVALAVSALEPLVVFHERIDSVLRGEVESPGWLLPAPWTARRQAVREQGVPLSNEVLNALRRGAERLGVAFSD